MLDIDDGQCEGNSEPADSTAHHHGSRSLKKVNQFDVLLARIVSYSSPSLRNDACQP